MNVVYKEVQHNNYSFSVGKKTWKSIKECCNYYGLEYQSVIQYKSNHQCDAEIAIQYFICLLYTSLLQLLYRAICARERAEPKSERHHP